MTTVDIYLSLGTNLGNREHYLRSALQQLIHLDKVELVAVSPVYETEPWGLENQAPFLNLACHLRGSLSATELLAKLQQIELDLDRVRHEHWGPRTIDIDILLYGDHVIDLPNLQVPHPYMSQRAFVLVPLCDISKQLLVPRWNETVDQLLSKVHTDGVVPYPFVFEKEGKDTRLD